METTYALLRYEMQGGEVPPQSAFAQFEFECGLTETQKLVYMYGRMPGDLHSLMQT